MNNILFLLIKKIKKRGGEAIPVQVDHEKADEIQNLFTKINSDQKGQLDILVNNAYKGVTVCRICWNIYFIIDINIWFAFNINWRQFFQI